MKKKIFKTFYLSIFIFGIIYFINYSNDIFADVPKAATGHMVRDNVDHMWFCVGTPVNCAF